MTRLATALLAATVALGLSAAPAAAKDTGRAFCDVADGQYFADAVAWAKSVGITSGVSETEFSPNDTTTRGQIVTLLHRFYSWRDGPPPPPKTHAFTDVSPGAFYAEAVGWAAAGEITTGIAANRFDPDGRATRAQLATFVHRAEGTPPPSATAPFDDIDPAGFYADAVAWMAETGLTTGTGPRMFSPTATSSRAEVITFLWRMSGEPDAEDFDPAPCPRTFTAIGDSVMGGTRVDSVLTGETFPGWEGIVDARGCREALETVQDTICGSSEILSTLATVEAASAKGTLGEVVIIHAGTNGPLESATIDAIVMAASPADTIWLMTIRTPWGNQVIENERIIDAVDRWGATLDVRLLDWSAAVDAQPEALHRDGIHLSFEGRQIYTKLIGDALAAS